MSKRVLIADDAAFMREMLREILTEGGYKVVAEASDGDTTLAAVAEHHPDVITLDIVMPGKSGHLQQDWGGQPDRGYQAGQPISGCEGCDALFSTE